jgi:hypothetical protein
MKWHQHPLINLLISVIVIMALISGAKLAMQSFPDTGILGDLKKFFMLA